MESEGTTRNCICFFIMIISIFITIVLFIQVIGVVFIIVLIGICILNLSNKVTQRRTMLDGALQRLEVNETVLKHDLEEREGEYVFPVNCPSCNTLLELNKVQWIDSRSAICPNCESIVGTSVQE